MLTNQNQTETTIKYIIHNDIFKYDLKTNDILLFENKNVKIYLPKYLYKGYMIMDNKMYFTGIEDNEFVNITEKVEGSERNEDVEDVEYI